MPGSMPTSHLGGDVFERPERGRDILGLIRRIRLAGPGILGEAVAHQPVAGIAAEGGEEVDPLDPLGREEAGVAGRGLRLEPEGGLPIDVPRAPADGGRSR